VGTWASACGEVITGRVLPRRRLNR